MPLAAIESESLAPGLSGTDAAGAGAGAGIDTGTDVGTAIGELSVVLPYAQVHRFAGLFTELDNHKDALCIDSYGVSGIVGIRTKLLAKLTHALCVVAYSDDLGGGVRSACSGGAGRGTAGQGSQRSWR